MLSFARKYIKQLLNTILDAVKKAGELLGNKIEYAVTKLKVDKIVKPDENQRNVEEIIIPLEKRDEILNKLRKVV